MLTPDDITKKTFTVRHVRGYDPQEVDDFLDRVVADYSTVLQQLNAANADLSRYRSGASTQQLPPVVTPPIQSNPIGDVARLLAVAQQSADQQAADAKAAALVKAPARVRDPAMLPARLASEPGPVKRVARGTRVMFNERVVAVFESEGWARVIAQYPGGQVDVIAAVGDDVTVRGLVPVSSLKDPNARVSETTK